jgi:HSP20 family molecular chaperone IbpA
MYTTTTLNVNKLFESFFDSDYNSKGTGYTKKTFHSKASENEIEIVLSVLGHSKDTVEIEAIDRNGLKITAKKEVSDSLFDNLISELDETILIPQKYDVVNTNATIENGILYISIPVKAEAKAKKVTIKVG